MDEIFALLRQPEVQLLTLTGAGGTGKTRLALQAAAELLDRLPEGVFFVASATLTDPTLILAAIATALGVREEGGEPLLEPSSGVFLAPSTPPGHRQLGAPAAGASRRATLLAAPDLTMLATSRAPLHLQAEREYPVPPLPFPEPDGCRHWPS